ncbi:EthD domain-containing protein [Candidimonas nitroreducens]|nr:EthD domain-containing protein [Candidimonas nitroreducens]
MIKRMSLVMRRPGMTREEFERHWLEIHAPLVQQANGILRYRQFLVRDAVARGDVPAGPPMPDGLTEIWYDSMETAMNSTTPERQRAIADCQNFLGAATTFFVEERPIITKA